MKDKPLGGIRIAVTRPAGQSAALVERLKGLGADTLESPTIRIVEPADPNPLRDAAKRTREYDWVVFTSVNGVEKFWDALPGAGAADGWPAGPRTAAIGPATARALKERGVEAELVPDEYVAEAVAEALIGFGALRGARVLLPRAAGARPVLRERLEAAGAQVDEVAAYRSAPDPDGIRDLRRAIDRQELDMVTFTAASTVRGFVDATGPTMGRTRVAVIGPITAAAARDNGVRVDVVADEYTVDGLVRAIRDFYANREVKS